MSLTSRKTDHADPPSSEEQLKHKALELFRNKVDAIEPLMRTTCHGLNNHLTRLLMHSELLGMLTGGDVTPKVSERLKQIQEEIETISCLVKGFRLVGRNGLQDQPTSVFLRKMIANVQQFSADQLKSRSITVDFTGVDPSHQVLCKETETAQVIYEIFRNAVDQCDGPGEQWRETRLSISSRLDDRQVFISLVDSGPAIDASLLDKIWQPFFSTKKTKVNKGIGLTVCRDFIVTQGGSIELDVSQGVNQFTIGLPTAKFSR